MKADPTYRFDGLIYHPFHDMFEWDSVIIAGTIRLSWLEAFELCSPQTFAEIVREARAAARFEYFDAEKERDQQRRWAALN